MLDTLRGIVYLMLMVVLLMLMMLFHKAAIKGGGGLPYQIDGVKHVFVLGGTIEK